MKSARSGISPINHRLSFDAKCERLRGVTAQMETSKQLCLDDAIRLFQQGREIEAQARLEKGARYAWGFNRPLGW